MALVLYSITTSTSRDWNKVQNESSSIMEILNKKKILTCVISAWNETVVSKIWFVLFDLHYLRSIELYRFFWKVLNSIVYWTQVVNPIHPISNVTNVAYASLLHDNVHGYHLLECACLECSNMSSNVAYAMTASRIWQDRSCYDKSRSSLHVCL